MDINTQIIEFYLGNIPDNRGRTLEQIWKKHHQWLEATHDYIQWLFPLTKRSQFNTNAPILIASDIQRFQASEELRNRLAQSLNLMLDFYGLSCEENEVGVASIRLSKTFPERKQVWLHWGNHNHLRITRILKSLKLLGLEVHAQAFFKCLEQIYLAERDQITTLTYSLWQEAVK